MSDAIGLVARWRPTLVLLAGLSVGCTAAVQPTGSPRPDSGQPTARMVDRTAFDAELAALRGRVVVVDFWALWCEPCVANFPHMIELADRHWDQGLTVVSVDLDPPDAAERVLEFLRTQKAGLATNLMSQYGGGSRSMSEFEIPGGSVPCYKLYDRKGQLRHTFSADPAADRQFTLQDLDTAVEKLLAE